MKSDLNLIICLLCCFVLLQSCKNDKNQDVIIEAEPHSLESRLDSIAQLHLDKGTVNGFSIAVRKDKELLYAKGFGFSDLEQERPVTTKTIFQMASITKLFTATAMMMLVEEGKVSLDDYLIDILPDFPKKDNVEKIKVRHLLAHTSGLQNYAYAGDSLYARSKKLIEKDDYYKVFDLYEIKFEPGEYYSYSNSGFIAAMLIIEKVSEMPFEDYIETYIAEPLQLKSLKHIIRNMDNDMTSRFEPDSLGFKLNEMDSIYYFKGDGGLSATAEELSLFPYALVEGRLISEKSLQTIKEVTKFSNGLETNYGLGLRRGNLGGHEVFGHTGGNQGFWAVLGFYPGENICITVFVNTELQPSDALHIEAEIALEVLNVKRVDLEEKLKESHDLSRFEGDFAKNETRYIEPRTLTYFTKENQPYLYRKRKGTVQDGYKMIYLGNNTFVPENQLLDRTVFLEDEDGNIIGYQDYYNGFYIQLSHKVVE